MKLKALNLATKWMPLLAIAALGVLAVRQWQPAETSRTRFQSDAYQVLKVSDGDTITATSLNTGQEARIRLACIDAPEVAHGQKPGQPIGDASRSSLKKWIDAAGGRVIVQQVDTDRYGRVVGEVFIKHPQPSQSGEELLLNAELVRSGMAYVYRQYAKAVARWKFWKTWRKRRKPLRKGFGRGSIKSRGSFGSSSDRLQGDGDKSTSS